jgi:hypothetical protein
VVPLYIKTSSNPAGLLHLMTQDDNDNKSKDQAHATYTATLPSDLNQALRLSLTKSLGQYYPVEEITPQLIELLERLDKQQP